MHVCICSGFMGDGIAVGAGNESAGHFGREGTKCSHWLSQASLTASTYSPQVDFEAHIPALGTSSVGIFKADVKGHLPE
jgi:hypothetical protein